MDKINSLPPPLAEDFKNKWDTFCIAAENANVTPPDDPDIFSALRQVFACSDFIAKTCTRNPQMLIDLIESGDLQRHYPAGEYANKLDILLFPFEKNGEPPDNSATPHSTYGTRDWVSGLQRTLRHIRSREMVRIGWRDLAGWADLHETMADLSAFADACIEKTLSLLYEWECTKSGIPIGKSGYKQFLIVIGMGKLGGRELNFSSDVDLIFAYPENGETVGDSKSISNDEFFVRLTRQMLNVIGAGTADGILFRMDMRLRPFGENGPLVMSFDAMEYYYQSQGREWERYAWIKARIVAGDKKEGACLLKRLKPFVYRRYLDYGAFESLREMKQKISLEVNRKGMKDNIKLGRGGIREVEFFGQIFQLIRGGVSPVLQERSIETVLEILSRENHISRKVRDELIAAYVFLRNTENHLQEVSDRQTHVIPSDPVGKARIAVSSGFDFWESFASQLERHRGVVHTHFKELLKVKEPSSPETDIDNLLTMVWQTLSDTSQNIRVLNRTGFKDPDNILILLNDLKNDLETRTLGPDGRVRLDKLIPILLKEIGKSEAPDLVLNRLLHLVKTIEKRTSYLSLLLENPSVLTHLIKLANASPWIISFLSRHPVLLDELIDPRTVFVPPTRTELEKDLRRKLDPISRLDLETQMDSLRIFKQIGTLHIATADIFGSLPLMKVSDHLSDLAETVLEEALELSWNHLIEKHGKPTCLLDGSPVERGFAVIAYGKLGGFELGYSSDLDLVFLHAGTMEQTKGGQRSIDNAQFFARLGQRVIHILSAHTQAGILYEADMRLRPSGSSGLLVSQIESFQNYQLEQARTWEHQALVRARAICGDKRVAARFEHIRRNVLSMPRDENRLREDVSRMRKRLRDEYLYSKTGMFDLIQGRGGIVDVEFLTQFLVLLNSHNCDELLKWTDNVRLLETLAKTTIIDEETAELLKTAYLSYRLDAHRLSLQENPAIVDGNRFQDLREKVEKIWIKIFPKSWCTGKIDWSRNF